MAARFGTAADGIVHVPRVSRMPPGENKDACVALGLEGWACVTNVDKDGTGVALGFDAIGRSRCTAAPGELSLLRMALDTIVYAVERHTMEKERARVVTRLQQAQRMETVGTLTSGIAHNFNNILGGILGHSEVIEEHLGPDARPLRNLDAIRRGAERARDLVDQILNFGRHRDARRRPLSARAVIAEAASLLNGSLPPGNGLGLASVHEIVRDHTGAMNVESAPGEGSRFEVWLPCLATATPAPELDEPVRLLGCGETVLMVAHDDARLLRDEEILAALG